MMDATEGRPEPDRLTRINGELVDELARVAVYADGLATGPMRLYDVLERNAWRMFCNMHTKTIYEYADNEFGKFVVTERPRGLGVTGGIPALLRMCEGEGDYATKARMLIRALTPAVAEPGAPEGNQNARKKEADVTPLGLLGRNARKKEAENKVDNINFVSVKGGTSSTYLLRRLKRDDAELAAKVVTGEMTAHAAAIEAGYRKRSVNVQPTVEGFLRATQRWLSAEDRARLKERM
jgi:hypothetical protein